MYAAKLIFKFFLLTLLLSSWQTRMKTFLVQNDLAAPNTIQSEVAVTQGKNWFILQEQFSFYEIKFHILHDCYQFLFASQQPNFISDTVCFCFWKNHASVKSYRWALLTLRLNFLISIPVLP